MSDTPRTDAEAFYPESEEQSIWLDSSGPYVQADFARELERENARLREKADQLIDAVRLEQDWSNSYVGECIQELEEIVLPNTPRKS